MTTQARLNSEGLALSDEINERLPAVTEGLVSHSPFDDTVQSYVPSHIRYVRDWLSGSTANSGNHWTEIQVIDYSGVNHALGLTATSNTGSVGNSESITDGALTNSGYSSVASSVAYVQLDLLENYTIDKILVRHYVDGRSYYGTKTEVSEDGTTWYSIFDSAIEGIYQELNEGRTHYLNDLGTTVNPSLNTGNVLSPNGVEISQGTTNIWTGDLFIYNNYGVPSSLTELEETYLGQPVYRLAMTVDDANSGSLDHFKSQLHSHGVYGGDQSWVTDTEYASSIYWRPVNKADTVFGGTASNINGWSSNTTLYLDDGWRRYHRSRTGVGRSTESDKVYHSFYSPSLRLNETIYIDVCCPQTEQGRTYPTAFNTGSARPSGALSIPVDIGTSDFTISGAFIPTSLDSDMLPNGSYFLNLGNGFLLRTYNNAPYVDGNTITGATSNNLHLNYNSLPYDEVRYIIKRSGTTFTWRMIDSRQDLTWTVVDGNVPTISVDTLAYSSGWEGTHKDISIYNRALSDAEITKLLSNVLQISPNGGILNLIEEKPLIPVDTLYFPFAFNGNSELNVISPTSDDNTVYNEGSVFIDNGSNLYLPYEVVDCKLDFTVFGFWKPTIYADGSYRPCICRNIPNDNDTNNRILVMGNGTTSRQLRTWYSSGNQSESYVFAPSDIPVVDDEWNFFSLVRLGGTLSLYIGNSNGFGSGYDNNAAKLNTDETNSQTWQVGEYNNSESLAYHRDYGFVQRALSYDELKTIFGTKMRVNSNMINVSNQVLEGVTL